MNSFQNKRRRTDEGFFGDQAFLVTTSNNLFPQQTSEINKTLSLAVEQIDQLSNQINTQNLLIQELHRKLARNERELERLKSSRRESRWDDCPSYIG